MALTEQEKQAILDAGHKVVLDGSASHKDLLTPFDAHEQASRGVHVPTDIDSPDRDPALVQEYPKHVTVGEGDDKRVVTANDAEHEAALKAGA